MGRRDFLQLGAAAAVPLVLPARLRGADSPSNRIRVGQIGCGRIARESEIPGVIRSGLGDIVALCDVDSRRLQWAKEYVEGLYRERGVTAPEITLHADYRELLARADVDAVTISTPDHQHAEPTVAAALAGKDIYLQKPLAMTAEESRLCCDVVTRQGRIFQTGSQQRSQSQFRLACELVRSGRVGRLLRVEMGLPIDPTKPDNPEQPVPAHLNYDAWLGPLASAYYTEQRVHSQTEPAKWERPGWLRWESACLGMITGWGSHHYDILHWALDCERGGPLRVEGRGEFPKNTIWNVHGPYEVHLTYPNDVRVHVSDRFPNGLKFIGDAGWIFVSRGDQRATASDPSSRGAAAKALDASDPRLLDPAGLSVSLYRSSNHHANWLECVKSRKPAIVPVDIGHHSFLACYVSWIAMKLGRPLTWDAKAERFTGDDEANRMLSRADRAGFGAKRLVSTK
jgi:predicted dehydrogenase